MSKEENIIVDAVVKLVRKTVLWFLGILLAGLTLAGAAYGGIWVYEQYFYAGEYKKLSYTINLSKGACSDDLPLKFVVANNSEYDILSWSLRLNAYRPGRSTQLADSWSSISDDKVIKSGSSAALCVSYPLKGDAKLYSADQLEWNVGSFEVRFTGRSRNESWR